MPTALKIRALRTAQKPRPALTPKQRERKAFTLLPKLRERFAFTARQREPQAFTLWPKLRGRHAFTLIELLVVMGIIATMMVLIAPAFTSLSKSNGRKAAIGDLLGGIEQARSQAIKDGQSTYVVFPTFGSGTSQAILDRYNYKSYATFEDDPTNPGTQKQITNWKTLPVGVALRAKQTSGYAITNLALPSSLPSPAPSFSFAPSSSPAPTFYLIKFNAAGVVEAPANSVVLGVFEGFVSSGNETITSGKDKNGNPLASEYLAIGQNSGRAVPTATPIP
jgi:prepilin-type N-terminal cleavage/methylation domain-containing protein